MTERNRQEKRCRGRPRVRSDEETRQLILEAANQQFVKAGYASANISVIAQTAGISTKTLYRLFPTKADLFSDVISKTINDYMLASDFEQLAKLPLRESLEKLLIAYGRLTLSHETIIMTRLVLGESERFPEIATAFYVRAIQKTSKTMQDWLQTRIASQEIEVQDVHAATGMLRGMMVMEPQRAVMLGQVEDIADGEIVARASLRTAFPGRHEGAITKQGVLQR